MCESSIGQLVGYQIRMEKKRSKQTKLLFCTTGVILRQLQDDSNLTGITHVVVDEVHERQQQTDVLLIILRQLLRTTRPDLKVILVSSFPKVTMLLSSVLNGSVVLTSSSPFCLCLLTDVCNNGFGIVLFLLQWCTIN